MVRIHPDALMVNIQELVVLVDEHGKEIGTADKATVHTTQTPLHKAFSLFLFNSKGEILLTKRASTKKTFPGVWTNTVCGHPGPGETDTVGIARRLKDELGISVMGIESVGPYRYRFADANGIVENEICPVYAAFADVQPKPNPHEIDAWKFMGWDEFLQDAATNPAPYSPWCREEALLVSSWLSRHPSRVQQ